MYVVRDCGMSWVILIFFCICGSREGGAGGLDTNIYGFLAIQVRMLAFNVGPSSTRQQNAINGVSLAV